MNKPTPFLLVIFYLVIIVMLPIGAFALGTSLSFDGSNDYVHLNHQALDGLNNFTVEYWILIVHDGDAASSISAASSNRDADEYLHYFDFQEGFLPHVHGEFPEEGSGFSRGQWIHFAMTRNGENGDWISYINGEEVDNGRLPNGSMDVDEDGLILGQDQDEVEGRFDSDEALRGNLDEMRIWSYVRTPEQIRQFVHSRVPPNSNGLHAYWDFDEGEGQVLGDLTNNNYDGRLGETDEVEFTDPRWQNSSAPIYGGIAEISVQEITFGPIVHDRPTEFTITIENVADVNDDFHALDFSFEDQELDPDWLDIDPIEGELRAGESVEITFTANPEGIELGEYEREVDFEINAANVQSITMPVSMIIVEGVGSLSGIVTDPAQNDAPIADAVIRPTGNFPHMSVTDEDGHYSFEVLPAFTYTFMAVAAGYEIGVSDEIEINDEDDIEHNFSMLHAEFTPNPGGIEQFMETNQVEEVSVTITNGGNFDLTWGFDIRLPDLEVDEPWEHLGSIPAQEILNNDRVGSTIFIDEHLYIAAGFSDAENMIYVMNRNGDIVREYTQFGDSRNGYRDMTWDGELIWAYDDEIIFGFDLDGELVEEIDSPRNPLRGITWDSENNWFWICNTRTNFYAVNLEGEIVEEINRGEEGLRVYGLTYYNRDPDGYYLYAFCQNGYFDRQVYKINTDDGSVRFVHEFAGDVEGDAGSATISGLWDPSRYVFIATTSNPDNIEFWNIESRSEWLNAEPTEGVIEAGDEGEITITLDTEGLPADAQFNRVLHFSHNADDGEYNFPITVFVQGEGGAGELTIPLSFGWNLVSSNIDPAEGEAGFADMLAPLVEDGLLVMAKDGDGNFFVPDEIDQMGNWQWVSGYWLKMSAAAELTIAGEILPWNNQIDLAEGWNTISYLPHNGVNPSGALRNLGDALIIVKNGDGQFYIHEFNFSSMPFMEEGSGYQIKVTADAELVYSLQGGQGNSPPQNFSLKDRAWINELGKSGYSHSLLVISDNYMPVGSRLEAFTPDGVVAGRGVADATGRIGIALWGDNPQTMESEGFKSGDIISLNRVNGSSTHTLTNLMGNTDTWEIDGIGVGKLILKAAPYEFSLDNAYPNPFNSKTIISFTVAKTESIVLKVYDINGRVITTLAAGDYISGQHQILWDASDVPSGVYSLYLKSNSGVKTRKVVLLK